MYKYVPTFFNKMMTFRFVSSNKITKVTKVEPYRS